MRRPRASIRALLSLVIGLGVVFGLGKPALLAYREVPEWHVHTFIAPYSDGPYGFGHVDACPTPWDRYWGHLMGRTPQSMGSCGFRIGAIEELCAWSHPEILPRRETGDCMLRITPRQQSELDRLNNRPR